MLGHQDLLAAGPSSESLSTDLSTAARGPDATGRGALGAPHAAQIDSAGASLTLVDRGVRGAVLAWEGEALPLAFAHSEQTGATLTVTVNAAVHPSCARKGRPLALTCGAPAEATALQREIAAAVEAVNKTHWGVSTAFVREQRDRWRAEGERRQGVTVAQYFADIGLPNAYDQTWGWCAGVLAGLEAKPEPTAAEEKQIEYYRSKVGKTERYEDMELTNYMSVLKHQDLAGPRHDGEPEHMERKVSYANFIAKDSDGRYSRMLGTRVVSTTETYLC